MRVNSLTLYGGDLRAAPPGDLNYTAIWSTCGNYTNANCPSRRSGEYTCQTM